MSKTLDKRVQQFSFIKESLFPDGNITPVSEIQERIAAGTHTVRDGLIARFYAKGIAIDPGLLKRDETKEFAQAMQKAFPVGPSSPTKNVEGFAKLIEKLPKNSISLDSSFVELDVAARSTDFKSDVRKTVVDPIRNDVKAVSEGRLTKATGSKTKKLAKGAVPPGVLKGVMKGIGEIPDPVMRDAVVASMLGLRGTDLSGIATTAELGEETYPPRPFYDPQSGTLISPDPELAGSGRKGKGPDRPLGPVMQQVLNRRYDSAVDGELFPNIDTDKIAAALKKYVYPKIDKETLAVLKNKPTGYTDIRRIVASAIANQLGDPQAAAEIISHTGTEGADKIDRVMTSFYTDVENLDSLEARRSALVGFEALMADATNSPNAKSLGQYLKLELPETFNAEYPKIEIKGSKVGSAVKITEATPEQIQAGRELELAQSGQQTQEARLAEQTAGEAADIKTIERGKIAPEVAAAEQELSEAGKTQKYQSAVKKGGSYIDQLKGLVPKIDPSKLEAPLVSALGSAYGVMKGMPGGVFDLIEVGTEAALRKEGEPDRFNVAQQKGGRFAETLGLPKQVGEGPAVAAELLTGAVADPQGAMTLAQQAASLFGPMKAPLPQVTKLIEESQTNITVPDPVPTEQGNLEAEGFKEDVNTARSQAMKNEPTSMGELMARGGKIPSFLYGGIVR